ncbi:hypothetical protein JQK88_10380 [Mesorhizobium caraganae]|uniref:hypothetical protein n=1 Tax=Mesorhizobium caraganae TaxID=483206 RepID=UPI00193AAD63|nr:hypothetical protein [Mesorhizobium caraganae]MBM2711653.1 hypothetical protein [Mesorhizobium caraganae]
MAEDEFQANWRGARKYQFDEETRRKQAVQDRKFPDPDPAPLPQPNEPIPSTEAEAPVAKSQPIQRGLSVATILLLLSATLASIAGYLTLLLYERQQIVPPTQATNAQPQTSTPNPSLPSNVPLPPNRPRR